MKKNKILSWIRKPKNSLLLILIFACLIIGIIDDNLEIIILVLFVAFIFGKIFGWILRMINK